MTRTRARRIAAATTLAIGLTATAGIAHAAVAFDESIQLSWDGTSYTGVTTESFLGTPVAVPGDSASRTLLVRNDGPTDGLLRASIVNVELLDPDADDIHHASGHVDPDGSGASTGDPYLGAGDQGSFYDDLRLSWEGGSASFTELHDNGTTPFLELELDKSGQVPVTLSYELPHEATSGNRANVAPRQASFDVLLEIGGERPTAPPSDPETPRPPEETGPPPPAPEVPDAEPPAEPDAGLSVAPEPTLPTTGVNVGMLVALAGLALAVGAGLAVLSARRAAAPGVSGRSPGR